MATARFVKNTSEIIHFATQNEGMNDHIMSGQW